MGQLLAGPFCGQMLGDLGADVVNFDIGLSSTSKGEELFDTLHTLEAMHLDAIIVRHKQSGTPDELVRHAMSGVSVINAGDGNHAHPTQGTHHANFDEAIDGAHAVIMLRLQKERMASIELPDEAAYFAHYGLDRRRLARAASGCLVMHPGPINRGIEIASDVADGPQSRILEQVGNGVFVRMAVLDEVLAR